MLQHIFNADAEFYNNLGYLIKTDLLREEVLDLALRDTKASGNALDKWKYQRVDGVERLAFDTSVMILLKSLYGREPFPFQTLNFGQSPGIGLHADNIHFHTNPPGLMCGVWVALEDVTMENGPLLYFPGSHKLPVVTLESLGYEVSYEKWLVNLGNYSKWMEARNKRENLSPKTLLCKRGTVLIWHSNLMHKSMNPKPGTTRASQVTHYYFRGEGVRYTVPAFGVNHEKADAHEFESHFKLI